MHSLAWTVYEYSITVQDEISTAWQRKPNVSSAFLLSVRFVMMLQATMSLSPTAPQVSVQQSFTFIIALFKVTVGPCRLAHALFRSTFSKRTRLRLSDCDPSTAAKLRQPLRAVFWLLVSCKRHVSQAPLVSATRCTDAQWRIPVFPALRVFAICSRSWFWFILTFALGLVSAAINLVSCLCVLLCVMSIFLIPGSVLSCDADFGLHWLTLLPLRRQ